MPSHEESKIEDASASWTLLQDYSSRFASIVGLGFLALAATPLASAHGGAAYFPSIKQWYMLVPLTIGVGIVAGVAGIRRTRFSPPPERLLQFAFLGLVIAAIGAIGLEQFSQFTSASAKSQLFGNQTMLLLHLVMGFTVLLGSLLIGHHRWESRPRYAMLGIVIGLWIAYPAVLAPLDRDPITNPIGYLLYGTFLVTVGYILRKDCGPTIRMLSHNRVVRRFGLGIGALGAFFFVFSSGIFTVLPEQGTMSWSHSTFAWFPIQGPIVDWPSLVFWIPSLPLGGYLSPGMLSLVCVLSFLIGLNGAIVAYQWLCKESGGLNGAAGAAAIAAPNACTCCGPVLTQLVFVILGPTVAMPIYWLFIDVSSPFGVLFLAGSTLVLLGNIVRFAEAVNPTARSLDSDSFQRKDSSSAHSTHD